MTRWLEILKANSGTNVITLASQWQATRLFVQRVSHVYNKGNTKVPHYWPPLALWEGNPPMTGDFPPETTSKLVHKAFPCHDVIMGKLPTYHDSRCVIRERVRCYGERRRCPARRAQRHDDARQEAERHVHREVFGWDIVHEPGGKSIGLN